MADHEEAMNTEEVNTEEVNNKEPDTEEEISANSDTAAEEASGEAAAEEASGEYTKEASGEGSGEDGADTDSEEDAGEAGTDANSGEDGAAADSGDKDSGEKESFFGKRKKNKKDPKDEKIEELTDRYTRLMAEFENFRKRSEKEKSQKYEMGAKFIIESILPVVDSFESGLKSIPEEEKDSPVAVGMDKIYKQLMSALEKDGVTVIEAEGKEFDPNLHNAMMSVEDTDGIGSNMVAMELQKGYKYRDQVVRHSMVSVTQ